MKRYGVAVYNARGSTPRLERTVFADSAMAAADKVAQDDTASIREGEHLYVTPRHDTVQRRYVAIRPRGLTVEYV